MHHLFRTLLLVVTLSVSTMSYADDEVVQDVSAEKEVVKVSAKGFEPAVLKLQREDASVFFVNTTQEDLLTFEIDFANRRAHCATSNLKLDSDGILRSSKPIGPKDFALTCFPEKGTYKVTVHGLHGRGGVASGSVIVE